jgi:hypothetical protein
MRTASILIAVVVSACANVDSSRAGYSAQAADSNKLPARYLSCGLAASENMFRCFDNAKAACPGGFTIRRPFPDLPAPGLVYECN